VSIFKRKKGKPDKRDSKSIVTTSKADSRRNPAEKYKLIIERIRRVKKKYNAILFAGANLTSLPITIPVNTAMQLASDNKRCLLIDLDLKRDAVAGAFDINDNAGANDVHPKAFRTDIEGLWVWPAHNFTKLKQMNLKPIVNKASETFDFILINAPYLPGSPDRKQIVSAAQAALIFSNSAEQAGNLAKLIKASGCALIANIQIRQQQASATPA